MAMTKIEATKIAHAVAVIRPDWDFPGIMAAIGKAPAADDYGTVLVTLATCAMDPGALTPAACTNPVYRPTWGQTAAESRRPDRDPVFLRFRAEHAAAAAQAAPLERVREIRAGTRWPVRTPDGAA